MTKEDDPAHARGPGRLRVACGAGLVALALLGALELALRALGVAAPSDHHSRLGYQALVLPPLVEGTRRDGSPVWRPADPRLAWDTLPRPKPAGALRVLVFGGSATAGLGMSPNAAFPRLLEDLCAEVAPGARVEVVNLGIVALASRQVQALVRVACERYEPDVVVVYSGNNEFLEVHSVEYQRRTAGLGAKVRDALAELRLARALGRAVRPRRALSLPRWNEEDEELRLSQVEILHEISLAPARVEEALDRYEANLERMADAAEAAGARLVLCTVASNWRWLGREDPPATWAADHLGVRGLPREELVARTLARLDEELALDPPDAHELLYHRALLEEERGDLPAAARDYRASMNRDPHLRRALDRQNDRVRLVAKRRGAVLVDAVEALAARSPDGIVGFEALYDYVHFTPAGALWMAAALQRALAGAALLPAAPDAVEAFVAARLDGVASLAARGRDDERVTRFVGFGPDPERLTDRDLWKYGRLLAELDERLAAAPDRVDLLLFRGDIHALRPDGGAAAEADYRRALALSPAHPVASANLAWLLAERGR